MNLKAMILTLCATSMVAIGCAPAQSKSVDDGALEAVRRYISAGDRQDAELFRGVSHENLRIVAVDYPAPGQVTVMSRDLFGSLLEGKKLGGQPREVEVQAVQALGSSSARIDLSMKSAKLAFNNQFTVIKTDAGWKVIQDLAHATPVGK